jgi:hypothetical protein
MKRIGMSIPDQNPFNPLRWLLILFTLFSLLAGCQDAPAPTTPPPGAKQPSVAPATAAASPSLADSPGPVASPATVQPTDTAAPLPSAAAPIRPRYELRASLDYDRHFLTAEERILYTNNSQSELRELILMVDTLYYPGVFQLKSMTWEPDGEAAQFEQETGRLVVSLPSLLAPGQAAHLLLSFELSLPSPQPSAATRPVPFGYTARQTNLVDWYPFVAPYADGKGWLANRAGFFGEHLAYESADFSVQLRVESQLTNLVIAASAAPQDTQDGWQVYQHPNARNFAWSVSPEYQATQATVGDVTVSSYAFRYHAEAAGAALQATAQALALYSELYAPYPRPSLSLVEADFLDGMEYDGLYFLSNGFYNLYQGNPGEYLTAIAAHETAHQWFYALVGNDQANEPWLDEALCTFHELVYYERYAPPALDWWWGYRVNYYDPRGWVDGSIYNPAGYRAYRDAVYLNGAVFLSALRAQVGAEAFNSFLRSYVQTYTGKIASGEDFWELLSRSTEVDLAPLRGEYFQK